MNKRKFYIIAEITKLRTFLQNNPGFRSTWKQFFVNHFIHTKNRKSVNGKYVIIENLIKKYGTNAKIEQFLNAVSSAAWIQIFPAVATPFWSNHGFNKTIYQIISENPNLWEQQL